LTTKYGTAAGSVGLQPTTAFSLDLAAVMVIIGLLLLATILIALYRDWQLQQQAQRVREAYLRVTS
jgi:hypothetical protein